MGLTQLEEGAAEALDAKDGAAIDVAPKTLILWEDDEATVVICDNFKSFRKAAAAACLFCARWAGAGAGGGGERM